MTTKVNVNDFFGNYQKDGNLLSFEERIEELVRLGFPIEFTDLNITVNSKEELSNVVNKHVKKRGVMGKIKIQRASKFTNKARAYQIFIDEQKVGTVSDGETKEFEIMSGEHTITAKIDWCSSPDYLITVRNGETKCLIVDVAKYANIIPFYQIICRKKYLIMDEI